ncbi:anaphase-promoting complex subunit 10 family protein [Robertkochia sediminum]|uniref:hypothetical protein n=1 Tax=Robertkochia sediminum TaxID=2785326 RepID=UPI001932B044|nr:hypothetical protein [Robertkochia sediminum]MBL7472556.1 hypothetical protein [Robertkochia sediminum]
MHMFKYLMISCLALLYARAGAQTTGEFLETSRYTVTDIDEDTRSAYWKAFSSGKQPETMLVYLKDENGKVLHDLKITDLESYSESSVTVSNGQSLSNVAEVIHLRTDYDVCCSNIYSTYFLKTKDGALIKLPKTEYLHCDGPTPITEYRFPNQKFGIKDHILLVKSYLNDQYEVDSVEVLKSYQWNGKSVVADH